MNPIPASPPPLSLIPVKLSEVGLVRAMAERIWPLAYHEIISASQMEYMLERMYSDRTLRKEIGDQSIFYQWIIIAGEKAGFLAAGPMIKGGLTPLHKFYLLPEYQGRGIGKVALAAFLIFAGSAGAGTIELRVNRANARAIALYEQAGFAIQREDLLEIGGGFVMDDYLMQRSCTPLGLAPRGTSSSPEEDFHGQRG